MTDEPFDLGQYATEQASTDGLVLAAKILASATQMEQAEPGSDAQNDLADQTLLLIRDFNNIETLPEPARVFALARVSARILNALADKTGSDAAAITARYAAAIETQQRDS